jgi:RNA polymerase sigma-70 factor, ECF subfamily
MKIDADPAQQELKRLYERYASLVYRRCCGILKSEDDAWDATQEVFMKLRKSLQRIDKKESVYSWLLSTSTNHCISVLRRKKGISFDEQFHGVADTAPQERRASLKEFFTKLFTNVDRKTQTILVYAYIDGYRQEEIARLTGMGESTIRKYLTRFKKTSAGMRKEAEEVLYG